MLAAAGQERPSMDLATLGRALAGALDSLRAGRAAVAGEAATTSPSGMRTGSVTGRVSSPNTPSCSPHWRAREYSMWPAVRAGCPATPLLPAAALARGGRRPLLPPCSTKPGSSVPRASTTSRPTSRSLLIGGTDEAPSARHARAEMALMDIDDLDGLYAGDGGDVCWSAGGWFVASVLHPCFPGNDKGLSSWPPDAGYDAEGWWTAPEHDPDGARIRVGATPPQTVYLRQWPPGRRRARN